MKFKFFLFVFLFAFSLFAQEENEVISIGQNYGHSGGAVTQSTLDDTSSAIRGDMVIQSTLADTSTAIRSDMIIQSTLDDTSTAIRGDMVVQSTLDDTSTAIRGDMITQSVLDDTAAAIRADFPSGGTSYTEYFVLDASAGQSDLDSAITAIQATFTTDSTNYVIELAPGDYYMSANVQVQNGAIIGLGANVASTAGNKSLAEDHKKAVVIHCTLSAGLLAGFQIMPSGTTIQTGYHFDNLVFKFQGSASVERGIIWAGGGAGSASCLVENCVFDDMDGKNTNTLAGLIWWYQETGLTVRNSKFLASSGYNGDGIFMKEDYQATVIENNYFLNFDNGVYLRTDAGTASVKIVRNNFFETCDVGLYVYKGTAFITGNVFLNSVEDDMYISIPSNAYLSGNIYDPANSTISGTNLHYETDNTQTDVSNFDGNLSSSDTDVQTALETLDDGPLFNGSSTLSTTGPTDNVDVSGIGVLYLNTGANSVTIGGFTGGVADQVLRVVRTSSTNDAIIEHNEGGGSQDILLADEVDQTLSTYGGWTFVCDGTDWFEVGY